MPEGALFVLFVGGAVVLAVAGLLATNRWLGRLRHEPAGGTVSTVGGMVVTLFTLVVAFTVVSLDGDYRAANRVVRDEANSLSEIVMDMHGFPADIRNKVDAVVVAYINEVRLHEFPALREGEVGPIAGEASDRLFVAVQAITAKTHSQQRFYHAATEAANRVATDRRERIAAASSSLPQTFWILMLMAGVLSVAIAWFFRTHSLALDAILVTTVATLVAVGVLTTLLLEYPFSGSVAVSDAPFVQGALTHLPGISR